MMDVDIPPAQDSPKHILNALNGDCIQLVLRRLDNIRDFHSAAETCVRFQENAKLIFHSQYKKVRIGKLNNDMLVNRHTVVDTAHRHSFLKIFGHLITELDYESGITDDITNMIADNCGKTLKVFKCRDTWSSKLIDFGTRSPFQVLEELEIRDTNVNNFKYYSQLKKLSIWGTNGRRMYLGWLIQTFPKLEVVELNCLDKLQYDEAVDFIKLNPQLKSLRIMWCPRIKSEIFQNMANLLPNLETLWFLPSSGRVEHLVHISKLQNLKSLLVFNHFSMNSMVNLVDSLIENNVPIENLFLSSTHDSSAELNISQLKLLKKLYIRKTTNATLIDYVENLPNLELLMCDESKINVNGIKAALQLGKGLTILQVQCSDKTTIDLDDYTSVLNLAKLHGVKVTIYIERNGTIDVPTELMAENRKWLCVKIGCLSVDSLRHFIE